MQFLGVGHIGFKRNMLLPDLFTHGNTAAFLMMRKADFEAAGGFNEGYECCYEDVELNFRVLMDLVKHNVTINSVQALHHESSTRKQAFGKNDFMKLAEFVKPRAWQL